MGATHRWTRWVDLRVLGQSRSGSLTGWIDRFVGSWVHGAISPMLGCDSPVLGCAIGEECVRERMESTIEEESM